MLSMLWLVISTNYQELLENFDTLETKVVRIENYECEDSSMSFVAHIEESVVELNSS